MLKLLFYSADCWWIFLSYLVKWVCEIIILKHICRGGHVNADGVIND